MDRTDEDRAASRPFRSMYGLSGFTWPEFIGTFAFVAVAAVVLVLVML